ncbi:MAG: hypothetical protein GXY55_00445 [Phycisphaerae bacterium]|nr:hypothetical protein [Phycisphaerae bacterium]
MDTLKWLAEYGFIDIIFGIGIVGFIWRLFQKALPSNYEHLHVNVTAGGRVTVATGPVDNSVVFHIRNAGQTNFYIARADFRAKQRASWKLWLAWTETQLCIHPSSDRITDLDNAIELKFQGQQQSYFTEYEALVRPGHNNARSTWIPLCSPLQQAPVNSKKCGTLYIEYATAGKQGTHVTRV